MYLLTFPLFFLYKLPYMFLSRILTELHTSLALSTTTCFTFSHICSALISPFYTTLSRHLAYPSLCWCSISFSLLILLVPFHSLSQYPGHNTAYLSFFSTRSTMFIILISSHLPVILTCLCNLLWLN